MTYTIEHDGTALTVRVEGHLDLATSPVIDEALKPHLDGVENLTLNLAGVDYISSMGLRLLLSLQKRMSKQGSMRVLDVRDDIMPLLDDTGFSSILTLERSESGEAGV